jgi:hypothetical protein
MRFIRKFNRWIYEPSLSAFDMILIVILATLCKEWPDLYAWWVTAWAVLLVISNWFKNVVQAMENLEQAAEEAA